MGFDSPCIIGATGGSGTRVVARIARRGGLFTGTRLNESEDAIAFGAFSNRYINAFLKIKGDFESSPLAAQMQRGLQQLISEHHQAMPQGAMWGWKEPRSIFLLPFFHHTFPRLKFLHVIRDGRDMAYSKNQNQLRKHGRAALTFGERLKGQPARSMLLWSRINLAAADYGARHLGGNYMLLRFEDLCAAPVEGARRVFDFFNLKNNDAERIAREEIVPPESLGRWRERAAPKELRELERVGAVALERFGYINPEAA